jgi:23S rRNA-/tRNA-specific pseudouridylate synthase
MPKKISINFEVNSEESGKRIDVIVSKRHPEFSRMQIKKFIELDFLSIDNQTIPKRAKKLQLEAR